MADTTFYEVLGVQMNATADEIRSAYRRLVLMHHPDRSSNPKSPELFVRITEAYGVLSDVERRQGYDVLLVARSKRAAEHKVAHDSVSSEESGKIASGFGGRSASRPSVVRIEELNLLSVAFAKGRMREAEKLAKAMMAKDRTEALPYAVLGDIARRRGDVGEATRLYSFAVQREPRNVAFMKRYEELLQRTKPAETSGGRIHLRAASRRWTPTIVGASVVAACAFYVAVPGERPVLSHLPPVSSWTLGLVFMLFLSGVSCGASLALSDLLDRLHGTNVQGINGVHPAVALGMLAMVSFPAAAVLYAVIGAAKRNFSESAGWIIGSTATVTVLLALAGWSSGSEPIQTLLWGGNIAYVGALCGWLVADSFQG